MNAPADRSDRPVPRDELGERVRTLATTALDAAIASGRAKELGPADLDDMREVAEAVSEAARKMIRQLPPA
jgi:hypothetical protein